MSDEEQAPEALPQPTDAQEAEPAAPTPEPIRGTVARVLNSRELVFNRGTEHGVEVGMTFDVLAPEGENIMDPDTMQPLGSVDRPKVAVRVVQVQPKLAVARTFRSRRKNVGGLSGLHAFNKMFGPPQYETEYDTFKSSERTWENLDETDSFVQTGDPVRQTFRYDKKETDLPN